MFRVLKISAFSDRSLCEKSIIYCETEDEAKSLLSTELEGNNDFAYYEEIPEGMTVEIHVPEFDIREGKSGGSDYERIADCLEQYHVQDAINDYVDDIRQDDDDDES